MESFKSVTKYVRISPRKARLAADLVRGLNVQQARLQLMHSNLRAGKLIKKTLDTAIADAMTLSSAQLNELFVEEIRVDAGPTLKRAKSKNKGGRVPVMKRTSHFTVAVAKKEV
jgi:large subunit ribosomal protein L22